MVTCKNGVQKSEKMCNLWGEYIRLREAVYPKSVNRKDLKEGWNILNT